MTTANGRTAAYPIDPLFLNRWSPRAFTGEAIPVEQLMTILEAARWAPSSYNSQPWRMIWARRDTPQWPTLFGLLGEFNQSWNKDAAALIIMVSNSTMQPPGQDKPVPSHTHSFDTGAAWASIALQATLMGWHAHGMIGFDLQRAFTELRVPAGYRVEAAIGIGRRGDKSLLPEAMQAREAPSDRQPLSATAFEGGFPG
ncbi:MAG: nitroreductase family protein [Acetobacteraceae bacterium]|nr:nitroreductase family protein [Acetobacteraceae bacterium]